MVIEEEGINTGPERHQGEGPSENKPAHCLILRQMTGQPTPSPPIMDDESANISLHFKHCDKMNIRFNDDVLIEHQSDICENESRSVHKSCNADRPVKFWLALYFALSCILPKVRPGNSELGLHSVPPRMLPSRTLMSMSLTPRHLWSLIWHMSFALCFILLASVQSDAKLMKSNQKLPPDCYDWFTEHGMKCPIKADWDPSWDDRWGYLNKTCCAGFPGTELHCQINGESDFPACLPDQSVYKGNTGQLIVDNEGNPQFKNFPCDNLTYESYDTVSSNVTFLYCLRLKSRCSGEGEALLCRGGPVADDICTCAKGYRPVGNGCGNYGNFMDQEECYCKRLTCSDDEVPMRTPLISTGFCGLMKDQVPPQFSCVKVPAVTDPSKHVPSQGTAVESEATDDPTAISHPKPNDTYSSSIPRTADPKDDIHVGHHFMFGVLSLFLGWLVFLVILVKYTE